MSNNIEKFIRPEFRVLRPYVPIEPTDVLSESLNIAQDKIIKLDGNENPYGCSPKVKEALARYAYYHHYPDPEQRQLRQALEQYTGFRSESIITGAGSDELIDVVLRLFLEPGDRVINCTPTFGMYQFCTEVCGGVVAKVPRREDFSIDVRAIKQAIDKKTKVIFIASPNNPSGNLLLESDLIELLETSLIVVVDEAYYEFSKISHANLMKKYSNLIILRTFSKWAGLAGLRIGYGFFPVGIVPYIMKIKQPYNVNVAAQIAAMESFRDINYLQRTVDLIIEERSRLVAELSKLNWLKVYPSQSNFILCKVLRGDAKSIHKTLQRKGIFIRYYDTPELQNFLRISVGKPEHTALVIAALTEPGKT